MKKGFRIPVCKRGHQQIIGTDRCSKCVAVRLMQRKYALSYIDWLAMFNKQNGLCLGCYRHQKDVKETFCVDHDHKSGRIRGLLCRQCNLAIGNSGDNASTLRRLADYIDGKIDDVSMVQAPVEQTEPRRPFSMRLRMGDIDGAR